MLQENPHLVQVNLKQGTGCMNAGAAPSPLREKGLFLRAALLQAGACVSYASRLGRVVSSDDRTNVNTGEAPLAPFDWNLLGCTTGVRAY